MLSKSIIAYADTLGSNFLLPVHSTDVGFYVMLSTRGDLIGTVTIELDVANLLAPIVLQANKTVQITEADIDQANYDKVGTSICMLKVPDLKIVVCIDP